MKKNIFFIVVISLYTRVFAQIPAVIYDYGMNCDNLYQNRVGSPILTSANQNSPYLLPSEDGSYFDGEYQMVDLLGSSIDRVKYITIEAVSFPFIPDFAELGHTSSRVCTVLDLNSTAFSDSVTNDMSGPYGLSKNFYQSMPSFIPPQRRLEYISYDYLGNSYTWNYPVYTRFSQIRSDGFPGTGSGAFHYHNAQSMLLSKYFSSGYASPSVPVFGRRIYYPHTVLKHTLWDMYGNKVSFIIDHTRGILSSYPFTNCGSASDASQHDLSLFVEHNNDSTCSKVGYATDFFNQYIGSINYPPINTDHEVIRFTIRGNNFDYPAGYTNNGLGQLITIASTPCYHRYFIDKSIDLTKINPTEKVIYHPSEVTVKSGVTLHFPSCYTFRTVRSTYPKSADMANLNPANPNGWNSIHNGGPYHDLREIPIPTDLSPTSDPNDASVYIIENGASVILMDGVTVYDCTFKVKPGGFIGNYDSKDVAGRFKIQWLDGSGNVINQFIMNRGRVQKEEIHLNNLIIDADVIFDAKRIYAGDVAAITLNPTGKRKVIFKAAEKADLKQINIKPNHPHAQYQLFFGNYCGKSTSAITE
ncbi:MAG: hypothetical protein NZ519_06515 [Bacteroidia bacterium]|nr:hypothetical protein [Bacteroidia bacterium]